MDEGSGYDKNVEYLMALKPDVKLSWPDAFWDASSINSCTRNIQETHEKEPPKGGKVPGVVEPFSEDVMQSWNDSTQSKGNKHTCTQCPIVGLSKFVPHGYHDARNSKDNDKNEIDDLR